MIYKFALSIARPFYLHVKGDGVLMIYIDIYFYIFIIFPTSKPIILKRNKTPKTLSKYNCSVFVTVQHLNIF